MMIPSVVCRYLSWGHIPSDLSDLSDLSDPSAPSDPSDSSDSSDKTALTRLSKPIIFAKIAPTTTMVS